MLSLGSSRDDVKAFPADARRLAGFQLRRVQQGLDPNDWRTMPAMGTGASEIRIHTAVEHRAVYVAKFAEAVYVLHAFEKKSRRTSKRDVDVARRRLHQFLLQRRSRRRA
ncbi:MAG: type II toxin-antitoxin system RelE/ParE family toxin [Candidatus Binatia bacterium]